MSEISYALSGSDLILASLLRDVEKGTYIDIGANHPSYISNTFIFYEKKWSGLAVDGNDSFQPLWAQERPNDTFVHALVSDAEKDVDFLIFPEDTMSSIDAGTQARYAARFNPEDITTMKMRTVTVDSLRKRYLPDAEIHLLAVDVEGEDLKVLQGCDLQNMRPGVIVVEVKNCSLAAPFESDIVQYLADQGYRFVAKTPLDAFFVLPEKKYLNWIPKGLL